MKRRNAFLGFPLTVLAAIAFFAPAAGAQGAAAVWQQVNQAPFDAGKTATLENVTLTRDRIRITLESGTIQFTQPAGPANVVFGAAFRGRGRVEVQPPNPTEAQQLKLFTGQDTLAMEFTEATFSFTDSTFDEVAAQVKWGSGAEDKLGSLYTDRQQDREDVGAEVAPRIFKGILSGDRKATAFFFADLKTTDRGWVAVIYDAMNPEEISVGRWADWGGARLFDTWMSFPAGNRTSAAAFRDPLAREDLVIRGYRIDAAITSGAELSATTQVTFVPRLAGENVILFMLDPNLRVSAVKDAGTALGYFQPRDPKDRNQSYGEYVAVALAKPTQAGQAMTLVFEYAGKRVVRQVGPGNYFCQSFGWYPTRETSSFATRADFEMNLRVPKKYSIVATGERVNETTDGDWLISSWKSDIPLAVAGFAFGDYKIQTEKAGDITVEIYANKQADDLQRTIEMAFDNPMPREGGLAQVPTVSIGSLSPAKMTGVMATEMANTLRLFEAYFGPYPYKRLAVANIPYFYGQGWPTLIYLSWISFLDSTQRNALGIRQHTGITDFFRAHESSHQWWGHRVSWKSYHDQWLSEGFAQFSGNLYVLVRKSEKEFLRQIREDRELLFSKNRSNRVYESVGPIWLGRRLARSESQGADYQVVIYNKGGLVLHALRQMMSVARSQDPDERFKAMMKDFCMTYNNQPASTEDFKAIVEKHMLPGMDVQGNGKMDWFFRQYVYGTGVPEYRLHYTLEDAGNGQWKLSGRVAQSGVPEGWMDAVPIYITHSKGKVARLGMIAVTQREMPFSITLPVKPESVVLNLYEDIPAIIK
jgi:hypothetical protein